MFIRIFVHLRNPMNVRQIEFLTICLYFEGSEDRSVVVQHLWCRIICQIVRRVFRKWMESKFLDQDVDVVSLIGCFVGRNYNKILMETGKLIDNIRVTKNGLGSGVDRMSQSSDSAFYHFTDRLNQLGKSVEFDILFLGPIACHTLNILLLLIFIPVYKMTDLLQFLSAHGSQGYTLGTLSIHNRNSGFWFPVWPWHWLTYRAPQPC